MSRTLLAIETSCDETAAAVVDDALAVRSSVVASQIDLHAAFGGVVPELASRAHLETITPIVAARPRGGRRRRPRTWTAVAVTSGPGLVGALLVGIATAKALALGWGIPVVGVNHLEGHLASVYLADPRRAVPPDRAPGVGRPLHAHPLHRAGALRAARRDRRRLHRRGLRQGGPLPRARLSGRAGARPPGRRRARTCSASPGPCWPRATPSPSRGSRPQWSTTCAPTRASPRREVAASFVAACMDVLIAKLRRALEEFGDPALAIVGRRGGQSRSCGRGPRCWRTSSAPGCSSRPRPWRPTTPP